MSIQTARSFGHIFWMVICAFGSSIACPASAQPVDGLALVQEHCGMCHAIGKFDGSPNAGAPPLREVGQRYSLDELQEMFQRGKVFAPHPKMPQFTMTRGTARAITIYLRSIQE